jgi:hypothetical protein
MQRYRNWSGTSGVREFEVGPDFIVLRWDSGKSYTYSYDSVGEQNVEEMKRLALKGSHLNKFINEHPEIRRGFVKAKSPEAEIDGGADSENLPLRFGS